MTEAIIENYGHSDYEFWDYAEPDEEVKENPENGRIRMLENIRYGAPMKLKFKRGVKRQCNL